MKRVLGLVFVITMIMHMNIGVYAASNTFTDVEKGYWAYENILDLKELGIVDGYGDGKFHPLDTLTAEQFVKMVVLIQGYELGSAGKSWSAPYIEAAKEHGLIDSTKNFNGLSWNAEITREQMAKIIVLADNTDTNIDAGVLDQIIDSIGDNADITSGYEEYVYASYNLGLITGYTDGNFYPNKSLSRAEGTAVIMRLYDESERKPFEPYEPSEIEEIVMNSDDYDSIGVGEELTFKNGNIIIDDDGDTIYVSSAESEFFLNLVDKLYETVHEGDSISFGYDGEVLFVNLYHGRSVSIGYMKAIGTEDFTIRVVSLTDFMATDFEDWIITEQGLYYAEYKYNQLLLFTQTVFGEEYQVYFDKFFEYYCDAKKASSFSNSTPQGFEVITLGEYTVTASCGSAGWRMVFDK